MKIKKSILVFILFFGIVIFIMIFYKNENNDYKNVIDRIDNKETFNIFITSGNNSETDTMLKYFSLVYNFEYIELEAKPNYESYNKLINKLSYDVADGDDIFVVVKNGKPSGGVFGRLTEKNFKKLLIDCQLIDEKYKYIDYLVESDFNEYNNSVVDYSLLLINSYDDHLYQYRRKLVDNNIKSAVLYVNSDLYTNEELKAFLDGISLDENDYPVLIKVKNKKVANIYRRIKTDTLVNRIKGN